MTTTALSTVDPTTGTGGFSGVGTYCPDASGSAPPFRSFVPAYPNGGHYALDSARNLYSADVAGGNDLTPRIDEYPAGVGDIGYTNGSTTIAPVRSIVGSHTNLLRPFGYAYANPGLAVAPSGSAFVGNEGQITIYGAQAQGDASPDSIITNTAGGLLGALDTATDAAGNVYVLYFADNRTAAPDVTNPYGGYAIAEYAAGGSMTIPTRVISGNATQLGTYFGATSPTSHSIALAFFYEPIMTVDPAGTIYVASTNLPASNNSSQVEIAEFDQNVSGNAAPTRTIDVNAATNQNGVRPLALAADNAHNVYLGDGQGFGVLVFDGTGAYTRNIPVATPGVGLVSGLALDASNDLVLQSLSYRQMSSGAMLGTTALFIYPPGAGANTAPTRSVTNGNTVDTIAPVSRGNDRIALDSSGNVYEISNQLRGGYVAGYREVSEYSTTASNDAPPISAFSDRRVGQDIEHGVAVDPAGRIYVSSLIANEVNAYAAGTSASNASPVATFVAAAASTIASTALALDASTTLYAASCASDSISIYSSGATTATRSIVGPHTLLLCPTALAVDSSGVIYALDYDAVRVFAAGASGDVAPTRSIGIGQAEVFVSSTVTTFSDLALGPGTIGSSSSARADQALSRAPSATAHRRRFEQPQLSTACRSIIARLERPLRTSRPNTTPARTPLDGMPCR